MPQTTSRAALRPKRKPTTKKTSAAGHPGQRRFVTILLAIAFLLGIGAVGLQQTALSADFTTNALTTGDSLTTIETQVQKAAGTKLTSIPGASTLVSRAISKDTTKAVIDAAVTDIYTDKTATIDLSALDTAVKSSLEQSTSSLSSALGDSIASALLPVLHNYINTQLASTTAEAKTSYQQINDTVSAAIIPLAVVGAVLAIWLLVVAGGFGRFLHNLGWAGFWAGILGTAIFQIAQKLPQVDTLAQKAGDLQLVVSSYIATVVNHISGYYLIVGAIGIVLLFVTMPFSKQRA